MCGLAQTNHAQYSVHTNSAVKERPAGNIQSMPIALHWRVNEVRPVFEVPLAGKRSEAQEKQEYSSGKKGANT